LSDWLNDRQGAVNVASANVNVRDFVAEAQFKNPSDPAKAPWSYGFIFRWAHSNQPHYRIAASSDGTWRLMLASGANLQEIAKGTIAEFKTAEGETNTLRVAAAGAKGWLFVNNKLVANLDLSAAQNSGDVLLGLSFFNDGVNGRRLRFEHFVVASNATLQPNTQAATPTATPRQ
jgi:hypothetical protein